MTPALALIFLLALVAGCGGDDDPAPREEGEMRIDVVAEGLEVPWEIAWLPDGRALVTERPGRIRFLDGGVVAEVDVSALGEGGLMGLALDPEFDRQPFVYLYFTTADGLQLERWRFADDRLTREASLIDGVIEAGPVHDSGRIAFGPDDALYVATGDAGNGDLAQDPGSLNGKYLRLEEYRGGPVEPEVLSLGHRNPQGFDWEPGSERLISTEHGPSGGDGPQGFDEVNEIRAGDNYGWPEVFGSDHGSFAAPLKVYEEAIAPSGAVFWDGDFVFATLRGEALRRLDLDSGEEEVLLEGEFGRLRTVRVGPDGALYVLTSNRDGRGSPEDSDDRVLRMTLP
ncbi:MAG TPA: PQQ-dependent sugar dehydrogenase [Solirubrobacteraceae bacterium]|nr:PQQ-dependent sugar dehydrogenase [Solirubrobacteraceae bacterium]